MPNRRVSLLLEVFGDLSKEEAKRIAEEHRLKSVLDKRYNDLSSGYNKRVQLAIALNLPVKIILLDEPFINVDIEYVDLLEEIILCLTNKLVLVVTHTPTRLLNHNIIFLEDGRVLYAGKIPNLLEKMVSLVEGERELPLSSLLDNRAGYEIRIKSMWLAVREIVKNR